MAGAPDPWLVVKLAAVALALALALPYLLPEGRRTRGTAARVTLAIALGLALAGAGAMTGDMTGSAAILRLGALLALVCGAIAPPPVNHCTSRLAAV